MVPRPAALPLGILMVGLGGILLFVAFHNLPDDIKTLPAFLGFVSANIAAGPVGNIAAGPVLYTQGKIPGGVQ